MLVSPDKRIEFRAQIETRAAAPLIVAFVSLPARNRSGRLIQSYHDRVRRLIYVSARFGDGSDARTSPPPDPDPPGPPLVLI